jgi:hypothetical protein
VLGVAGGDAMTGKIRRWFGRWSGRHLYTHERKIHGASRWGAALFAALAILQRELDRGI